MPKPGSAAPVSRSVASTTQRARMSPLARLKAMFDPYSNPDNMVAFTNPPGDKAAIYPAPQPTILAKKSAAQKQGELNQYGRVLTPHEQIGMAMQQRYKDEQAARAKAKRNIV